MQKDPVDFDQFLKQVLPLLDGQMAILGTHIQDRPLSAARSIVDIYILSVKGDTKENYIEKPWFAQIFKSVRGWYERRYGVAMNKPRLAAVLGVFSYFDTPYLIRVPLVVSEPVGDGTVWIKFPVDILASEDPYLWVQPPLPVDLPPKRRASIDVSIKRTVTLLRSINLDLTTADLDESDQRSMVRNVIRHLEKAASDMVSDDRLNASIGVWDLHMACEKVIKVYLSRKRVEYPPIHDLRKLQRLVPPELDWSETKRALAAMPSERRVMAWRYSQGTPPTPKELERMYFSTLSICAIYAGRLPHKFRMANGAFHLRRPPWFGDALDQADVLP